MEKKKSVKKVRRDDEDHPSSDQAHILQDQKTVGSIFCPFSVAELDQEINVIESDALSRGMSGRAGGRGGSGDRCSIVGGPFIERAGRKT